MGGDGGRKIAAHYGELSVWLMEDKYQAAH